MIGGAGNDDLYGDRDPSFPLPPSNPTFTGGADSFVFANGSGQDTIFDFENGRDLIDLTGFAGIADFAQIGANAVPGGVGDTDTVIDLGAAAGGPEHQDVLTLANFAIANLNAGDFVFT